MPEWEAFEAVSARPEPTVFRVRTGRVNEEAVLERLAAKGFRTHTLEGMPGFHVVESEPHPLSGTFEHWAGHLYVQQASTGVAAAALDPRPGERVLDLCAAPGGKTAHLVELMEERGCVVANEIDEGRIRGLLGNMYRLGLTNVLTVSGDGRSFPAGATFDRVLVDAPCSGEGTLRRRSGRVPRPSASFLGYVTGAQRALLRRAVELTRPGGSVLYVTCTFAPEENEAVVSEALSELPVELEPLRLPVPHAPGLTEFEGARYDPSLEGAARVYPHHLDSGGLFLAKLRKREGPGRADEMGGEVDGVPTEGWTLARSAFPESPQSEGVEASATAADDLVRSALEELDGRFGVPWEVLEARLWTVRGGRVWMHGVHDWPLDAWEPGAWRPVSLGIRAVEFDSRGRARPTNDVLRLLSPHLEGRRIEVDREALGMLLDRRPVPHDTEVRGPVALSHGGEIVGRGALTGEGLKSEIPKARAGDLRRVLGLEEGNLRA